MNLNSDNVILLRLEELARQGPVGAARLSLEQSLAEDMDSWLVADAVAFLTRQDLSGPAGILSTNGINGHDFARTDLEELTQDLRLSRFVAQKVLRARVAYLDARMDATAR